VEEKDRDHEECPDEVVELVGPADHIPEDGGPRDAEDAVGPAGDPEKIVGQGDAQDLAYADRDDAQVVAPQVDDGPGDDTGEKACRKRADGKEPQHGDCELRVEDGRRVGPHGEEGRVPQVEKPRVAHDEVEREPQDGIEAHVVEHVHPVGVEKSWGHGQHREYDPVDVHALIFHLSTLPGGPGPPTIKPES
jgi:hypothetical protein